MKYLLIFILSFILVSPAVAVLQVPGQVPDQVPLQPAPEGISPNLNNNIQFSDPTYKNQFQDSTSSSDGSGEVGDQGSSQPILTFKEAAGGQVFLKTFSVKWWLIVISFIVLLALAIFAIKRQDK